MTATTPKSPEIESKKKKKPAAQKRKKRKQNDAGEEAADDELVGSVRKEEEVGRVTRPRALKLTTATATATFDRLKIPMNNAVTAADDGEKLITNTRGGDDDEWDENDTPMKKGKLNVPVEKICSREDCKSVHSSRWHRDEKQANKKAYVCGTCYLKESLDRKVGQKCSKCDSEKTSNSWVTSNINKEWKLCQRCYIQERSEMSKDKKKCADCGKTDASSWVKKTQADEGEDAETFQPCDLCISCYQKRWQKKNAAGKVCCECNSTTATLWYKSKLNEVYNASMCKTCYYKELGHIKADPALKERAENAKQLAKQNRSLAILPAPAVVEEWVSLLAKEGRAGVLSHQFGK